MLSEYIVIGIVVKPQGIEGLVKIKPATDDPGRFYALQQVYYPIDDAFGTIQVDEISVREGFVYCRLGSASTRDEAEAQRGLTLYVHRAQAVLLPEGRHFIIDLIGCKVVDTNGEPVGVLREVLQPGANDVYVIEMPKGRMLLPALKRVVLSVDVHARIIVIDQNLLDEVAVIEG